MTPRRMDPDAWGRAVIEAVSPEIDYGRFPIKRTAGEDVEVEADIFSDGHDVLAARLLHRREGSKAWAESSMLLYDNDRWRGAFTLREIGTHAYTIEAWVDAFATWKRDLSKRLEAGQEPGVELLVGADLVEAAARGASGAAAKQLLECADMLRKSPPRIGAVEGALSAETGALMAKHGPRGRVTRYGRELSVTVDRERSRFGAWYEFFPRSTSGVPGRHGTFKDCERRLEYVASMGFDVAYLPPIHPIGRTHRKGRNNQTVCLPTDPGSPWAIGSEQGGHCAVHPELGTLDDFRAFRQKAEKLGIEIALDIALQCSPDHPYAKEHPEWFRRRPDGSIRYAENPPKKYEDIYPFDMESETWSPLWEELKGIFLFWAAQGVRIFRVDNPHTKPFAFWERTIREIKQAHPDAIFLSEAFTRPKIMYQLAKLGFTQSYTYFAWRNSKWELTQYLTELTQTPLKEYFNPTFWPNTPDILTAIHQQGGRPAFLSRFVLASTLGANYGVYGPAFELCVNKPRQSGSEEYLDSEKYEIKRWDLDAPHSLKGVIAKVNRARRENPALQSNRGLRFHDTDNEQIICYSKRSENPNSLVIVAVNLDWRYVQSAWVDIPVAALGLDASRPYRVHDLLSGASYVWGTRNFVKLDPNAMPAHLLRVEQ